MKDEIVKMFDTNELNRLQRCAKNKDKKEIIKWGQDFEARMNRYFNELYQERHIKQFEERLKDLDVAVMYTLHFSESTKFGNKRLNDFMKDLAITLKGFYKDDFKRQDYIEMLKEDRIKMGEWK